MILVAHKLILVIKKIVLVVTKLILVVKKIVLATAEFSLVVADFNLVVTEFSLAADENRKAQAVKMSAHTQGNAFTAEYPYFFSITRAALMANFLQMNIIESVTDF